MQGQILGIRDMQEAKGGQERRKLTGRWPWCLHQLSLQELQNAQVLRKTSRQMARVLLSSLTVLLALPMSSSAEEVEQAGRQPH